MYLPHVLFLSERWIQEVKLPITNGHVAVAAEIPENAEKMPENIFGSVQEKHKSACFAVSDQMK